MVISGHGAAPSRGEAEGWCDGFSVWHAAYSVGWSIDFDERCLPDAPLSSLPACLCYLNLYVRSQSSPRPFATLLPILFCLSVTHHVPILSHPGELCLSFAPLSFDPLSLLVLVFALLLVYI